MTLLLATWIICRMSTSVDAHDEPQMTGGTAAVLTARYERIAAQLAGLFVKVGDPQARMASAAALLQHKQPHFFWTGFYRLVDGELLVGPYQGPLACMQLAHGHGVCWACVQRAAAIIVPNVHEFPGHIPCDTRSLSEVVVPVRNAAGAIVGVLDVDSAEFNAFSAADATGLQRVADMIYAP
jgi:L-methionine (R)-S-oxide reductase